MRNSPTLQPKLIISDIDKTLTTEDVWYTLTSELHGDLEKHYQLYTQYIRKQISFVEMKKGLFEMWQEGFGGPIPRRVIENIFFKVQLRGEAFAVFSELRNRGYKVCLVSSYMDVFVKQVAQRLQLEDWYANSVFKFDKNDHWIDYDLELDEGKYKLEKINDFIAKHNISPSECIVLGGGYEEVEIFKHFPGVAINTDHQELIDNSWKEIKYLPTLLQLLNQYK